MGLRLDPLLPEVVYYLEMTNLAAAKTTKQEQVREAKRAFILGLFDLSWKLAGAFLIPVFAGVILDQSRDDTLFTYIGVGLGFAFALLVIAQMARSGSKFLAKAKLDDQEDDR